MLNVFRVKYYDRSGQVSLFFIRNYLTAIKGSRFYSTKIKSGRYSLSSKHSSDRGYALWLGQMEFKKCVTYKFVSVFSLCINLTPKGKAKP